VRLLVQPRLDHLHRDLGVRDRLRESRCVAHDHGRRDRGDDGPHDARDPLPSARDLLVQLPPPLVAHRHQPHTKNAPSGRTNISTSRIAPVQAGSGSGGGGSCASNTASVDSAPPASIETARIVPSPFASAGIAKSIVKPSGNAPPPSGTRRCVTAPADSE